MVENSWLEKSTATFYDLIIIDILQKFIERFLLLFFVL